MRQNRRLLVLEEAVAALQRTTALDVRVLLDNEAAVEVKMPKRLRRYVADVKTVDRFETPALVKARGPRRNEARMLVAPYITRQIAERCRELKLPFIDTAGNAYIEADGLLVYIVGNQRPVEARAEKVRAFTPAGLQVTFALLCRPDLLNTNYRTIAAAAKVALGTVGPVIRNLQEQRLVQKGAHGLLRFLDPRGALEEWTIRYPTTLRPKAYARRFEGEREALLTADLTEMGAVWGGEAAAYRLTGMLLPAGFTIYTEENIPRIATVHRLRAAQENGNVEVLRKFWNFTQANIPVDVAPPQLVYADLMATKDGRNVETANLIYEQFIHPTFHRTR
jgi:hypothetical protein